MVPFEPLVIQAWAFLLLVFAVPVVYCSIKHNLRWLPANVMLLIGAIAIYGALEFVLSHPKPWSFEWAKADRYRVVSMWIIPKHAIYTWMIPQGEYAPRYYRWAWSLESQNELIKLGQQAAKKGVPLYYEPNGAETDKGGLPKLRFNRPSPPSKP